MQKQIGLNLLKTEGDRNKYELHCNILLCTKFALEVCSIFCSRRGRRRLVFILVKIYFTTALSIFVFVSDQAASGPAASSGQRSAIIKLMLSARGGSLIIKHHS